MSPSPRREHPFVEPPVNSSHYLQLAQSTLLKLRKKKDSSLRIRVLHKELIKNIWKLPPKPVKTRKVPNILRRRGIQKPRARRGVTAIPKPLSEYIEQLEKESALRETSLHHKMLRQVKTINKCKTVTDLLKTSKKLKFECDRLVAQRSKDNQESMWSCEKCDRGFKDFSSYNHHMEYHSKVTSFMEDSEPKCVEPMGMSSK
ncbi:hypothetical protein CRE_10373 [Caenorhabditis remanei]|uniref:C2H2-type domain-containing protein n=1 Tax=Caenorhabditis remanei TaxID=31234 RepID=E3MQM3_CAERE|nr:hypothetical protein CRE_10373 [Caenorhabditis remanei]